MRSSVSRPAKAMRKGRPRATSRRRKSLLCAISPQRGSSPSQRLGPSLRPRLLPRRPKATPSGMGSPPRRTPRLPFTLPPRPRSLRGRLSQARSRHRRLLGLRQTPGKELGGKLGPTNSDSHSSLGLRDSGYLSPDLKTQTMSPVPQLRVEVVHGEIIVTLPGFRYSAAGPGADRRREAQRQAGRGRAALGAAAHPGRRAGRGERGGRRLAAGHRGRRRRRRAVRRVQADG